MAVSAGNPTAASGTSQAGGIPRHTAIVRATHWITTLCFFALLVSGAEIVISHPRFYWGETGNVMTTPLFKIPIPSSRSTVPTGYKFMMPDANGWGRALHFQSAWVVLITGIVYVIAGAFGGHFRRNLVPGAADLSLREISADLARRFRFERPGESHNTLQRLSYLSVIFVLFPLVIWTGLAMSPAFVAAFPAVVTTLGGRQSARTIHFFVSLALSAFLVVHIVMIFMAGFRNRTWAMISGDSGRRNQMSRISRRKLIGAGVATAAGITGLGAAVRAGKRYGLIPPDCGGIYGLGETLNYGAQRMFARNALAREFPPSAISKPFANETGPLKDDFKRLQAGGFRDWRLAIDGLVARPASLTIDDVKRYPSRTQITELACEEGWSYIAEWTGTPLAHILEASGVLPTAKYVFYFSIQRDTWESIDIAEAMHPQTLVAYGMNGGELPVGHGGPLRMRVPRQLGYKNVKFINRLAVADSVKGIGTGVGSPLPEYGYTWFAGI